MSLSNKRNYLYTLFFSFGGQIISTVIGILSVPISLHYWGKDVYGIYTLINSIIVYVSVSNLGINSAANFLMGKNNKIHVKNLIFRKSLNMGALSIGIFLIAFILLNLVTHNWVYFLGNIPSEYFEQTYLSLLYMVVFYLINNVLGLFDAALYAFQRLYVQKIFDIVTSILLFICLIVTVYLKQNLVFFVIIVNLAKTLINLSKIPYLYFTVYKKNQALIVEESKLSDIELEDSSSRAIFVSGLRFFTIGIAAMVVWNTDNLVISHFMDIALVTPYSITFKLYTLAFTIIFIINGAASPIISKEVGYDNWVVVLKIYNSLVTVMTVLGGLLWVGGIIMIRPIIDIWTGPSGYAGLMVVFCFGGYSYLLSIVNINAGMFNLLNFTRIGLWVAWLEAIVNFGASVFFLRYFGLGGVALGTLLGALIGPGICLPYLLANKTENKIIMDLVFMRKHFLFILVPLLIISVSINILNLNLLWSSVACFIICTIYLLGSYVYIPQDRRRLLFEYIALRKK